MIGHKDSEAFLIKVRSNLMVCTEFLKQDINCGCVYLVKYVMRDYFQFVYIQVHHYSWINDQLYWTKMEFYAHFWHSY